jgi:molecular chaperone GrpE
MGERELKTSGATDATAEKSAEDRREDSEKTGHEAKGERQKQVEEMTREELIDKLKDVEKQSQENYDVYMRAYAEMENIKKRGAKEREDLAKFANESLIKEILPVIDSLEKALIHARDDTNPSGLAEGIEMILKGLRSTLEKAGLREIEAMGKPFDPHFHEAMSQQPDDTVPPKHVIMEMQKGYLLNGRLIRPSMVVISQGNGEKNIEDHA